MQTIVLYLCYIVLIVLFFTAYNTSLIYCFVIWCLHTNKRRPCSSTLSGHPSSSFSSVQMFHTHTHTPCLWQGGVLAHEVKMRMTRGMMMRWKWRWDERLLNRDPGRGTQKKREEANTHQHTWPGAGKPWKGKGKENRRPTDTEQDQRRGAAKTYAYLGTRRTRPT